MFLCDTAYRSQKENRKHIDLKNELKLLVSNPLRDDDIDETVIRGQGVLSEFDC